MPIFEKKLQRVFPNTLHNTVWLSL